MSVLLVGLVAVFFLGMGVVALRSPAWIGGLFGIAVSGRDARNEVRAVYGGFGLAVAALLLATFWVPALRTGGLASVAVALVGMAAGRLFSALVDGSPGFHPWLFCGVELALAGALLLALGLPA